MNTKILEYIIAIAQERSISRAAERFYLTQPVLSRHLKKIEDELGAPLFVRQRDGMTLTEAGRIYINSAQNILHLEAELESDLRAMRAEEKSTLRVYVDFLDTDQLTQQILPPFREQYRDVRVRFVHMGTEEIQSYLSSGEAAVSARHSSRTAIMARSALPRWLMAFFCSSVISALVLPYSGR